MIRKLMRSIREQKRNSILAMVTISGEVVFEVIIPMLMANLIDYGIDGLVTDDIAQARELYEAALHEGHEYFDAI